MKPRARQKACGVVKQVNISLLPAGAGRGQDEATAELTAREVEVCIGYVELV